MHSFGSGFLEKQPIPHSLLRTIRLLGEYRGKEALFNQQTPQVLESLRQVAIVQSTESSNRRTGELTVAHGAKRQLIMDVIGRLPEEFRVADIEHACPGVSRPTINRALRDLREDGKIACIKGGRDAVWQKMGS